MAAKCGESELDGAYQSRSLSDFGAVSLIWGAFWGFLLQQKMTPGILVGTVPEDEAWWKMWVRALVGVGLVIPWLVLGLALALTPA